MDGMPVIAFSDYITNHSYSIARNKSNDAMERPKAVDGVVDIFATCRDKISSDLKLKSMIGQGASFAMFGFVWKCYGIVFITLLTCYV
jgi:hypothetical protein